MSVLKRSDPSLLQTAPGLSQGPGHVPASTAADGGKFRVALEGTLDPSSLKRWGADASTAWICQAVPGSVREFPQFERGAGI
jgi:hypothetical protein